MECAIVYRRTLPTQKWTKFATGMTDRTPHAIIDLLDAAQPECLSSDYSNSEKLLIAATDSTGAAFRRFTSFISPNSKHSDADIVYKYLKAHFIQLIMAAFIFIGAITALIFPFLSAAQLNNNSTLNMESALNGLKSFYIYYSNELFSDASTFTTLSIGVIAGSISIAALGRARQSQESGPLVPFSDLLNRFAFIFNGLFIIFYSSQIFIWLGGFIWRDEICHEEMRVGPDGMSYFVLEECGISSPIIVIDSLLVILVCTTLHSLTLQSRRQSAHRIDHAYAQLLQVAEKIKSHNVARRKFPIWNVIHLYTALATLLFLFSVLAIELSDDAHLNFRWPGLILVVYAMSLILALFGYVFYPYMVSEFKSTIGVRIFRTFLHGYISLAFALSIAGALPITFSNKSFLLMFFGALISFNAPLLINRIPEISIRIQQRKLNENFRSLLIKARLVEKYQILSKVD